MNKKFIALLPMKGHSERVPHKNTRAFCGSPLFLRIGKTLEQSELIEKIVIDTDSKEIASIAQKELKKSEIIFRQKELCGDYVSMNKIIEYDLSHLTGDFFIQTHSTNPLLSLKTLNSALSYFLDLVPEFESLFSVTKHQSRFFDKNLTPINHEPSTLIRTQDLPPLYEENSSFYIFTRNSFVQKTKRIGQKFKVYEIPKLQSIDIDEEDDFSLAEIIYEKLVKKEECK